MKHPDELLKELKSGEAEAAKLAQLAKQADAAKQRAGKLDGTLKSAQAALKGVQD
jgi:hypothetical protein